MRALYHRWLPFLVAALVLLPPAPAPAEEGGTGHYFPGSMASFIDGIASEPTLLLRLNLLRYDGSFGAAREVPIAGLTALDVGVTSAATGLTAFWRPSWGQVGEDGSFAMSATLPLVHLTVGGRVQPQIAGPDIQVEDTETGLGDILFMPAMYNYHVNADLNLNARIGIYAPTGSYETGRLANTGKNFWTVEPAVALIYMGQKNGREGALFLGLDFNQENPDTDYKSGASMHAESTLAQHFPLLGGVLGVGGTGFWYEQVADDSGAGASLGKFRGRAHGAGPILSWIQKAGTGEILATLKWLHEFDNRNRPEGDTVFLKFAYSF